jgi:hypothetical protein
MTDLVKRLREYVIHMDAWCQEAIHDADIVEEAADRIEKLEAALQKIKDLHHEGGIDDPQDRDDMTYKIVCDTLEGKDGKA